MPSFVVIIALMSFLSFTYSLRVFNVEIHRLHLVSQPFGGHAGRMTDQILRLTLAAFFLLVSLLTVAMSMALAWLATQPTLVG